MIVRRAIVIAALGLVLFAPGTTAVGPLQFYTVTPCRLLDTRDPTGPTGGPFLSNGVTRAFPVFGSFARPCGIPSTAKGVSINAAIITPTGSGFLSLWANNAPLPITSNINFNSGETVIANGALVKLTYPPNELVDPNYQLAAWASITGGATAHLVVDITGYYQ
jgi:hypothetical protein